MSYNLNIKADLRGVPEALAGLKQFKEGIQRKHIKIALSAAGGVFKPEAVKRAPSETGLLKKSIKVKTSLSKKKDNAYAVVGASRQVKRAVGLAASGKNKGKIRTLGKKAVEKLTTAGTTVRYRQPARYSHLVEKGTKRGVKATRFLADTVASKKDQAGQRIVEKLRKGVEEEAAKALAKSK